MVELKWMSNFSNREKKKKEKRTIMFVIRINVLVHILGLYIHYQLD